MSPAPGAGTSADISTWIFLGTLAAATGVVLVAYGRAIRRWVPPEPRTDLVSPDHFARMRGDEQEVDLGRGWRSSDDPGAAWHVWWMPHRGEIVGLRYSALPPPPGPAYLGSYHGRTLLDPIGVRHFTGMRVLGYSADRPTRAEGEDLRLLPDGLDRLTGGTRGIVADDDGRGTSAEDGPGDPEG